MERAHVVESIGQLDELGFVGHVAGVFGKESMLGFEGSSGVVGNGELIDEVGDAAAELLAQLAEGDRRVFDDVVEIGGGEDGGIADASSSEGLCDGHGVFGIGLAAVAFLSGVGMDAQGGGASDEGFVGFAGQGVAGEDAGSSAGDDDPTFGDELDGFGISEAFLFEDAFGE